MSSRIEAGITIEGSIRGEGELEVAGRVRGALTIAGKLTVEETGIVEADVEAEQIEVAGVLSGSATAHASVKVLEGGRVEARVRSPKMLVDDGAVFRGELQSPHDEEEEDRAGSRKLPARASRGNDRPAAKAPEPRANVRGKTPHFAPPPKPAKTAKPARDERSARPSPPREARASAQTREFPIAATAAATAKKPERRPRSGPPKMPSLPKGRTTIARREGDS